MKEIHYTTFAIQGIQNPEALVTSTSEIPPTYRGDTIRSTSIRRTTHGCVMMFVITLCTGLHEKIIRNFKENHISISNTVHLRILFFEANRSWKSCCNLFNGRISLRKSGECLVPLMPHAVLSFFCEENR